MPSVLLCSGYCNKIPQTVAVESIDFSLGPGGWQSEVNVFAGSVLLDAFLLGLQVATL